MNDQRDLEVLIASRNPIISIETQEEARVLKLVSRIAAAKTVSCNVWSVAEGLRGPLSGQPAKPADATQALRQIDSSGPGLYVLLDFHPYLENPVNVRLIRKIAQDYELTPRTIIFVSHALKIPPELEKLTTPFRLSLPDAEAIKTIVKEEVAAWEATNPGQSVQGEREAFDTLLRHLNGLSAEDVRRLARGAIADKGAITMDQVGRIVSRKHEMLAKDSVLSFELDTARFSDVAGLVSLKKWLEHRKQAFLGDAAALGLDVPKGIMLLGVQGCGKSLAAKATAGAWAVPLMRLDFGGLYNKYLGETERNLREALEVADAMSPCVLWMDEIEKGVATNDNDGGESRRLLGTLLTWMAERKTKVFLVATSNDIERLPPELVRKGRLDEIFFVDLPDATAREEIFKIHLKRRKQDPATFEVPAMVAKSEGFSGAEIEQAVVGSLYAAHAAGEKLSTANVVAEVERTRPLSVVMAEKIAYLRIWAADRTVKAD
jgi:ATP-dependent 26S proteasome regulatory subunit